MGALIFTPDSGSGGTLAPQDVYVATTGSDANDGLSPAAPVATLARAYELVGTGPIENRSYIHLASGSYELAEAPFTTLGDGLVTLLGDGAGQAGDDGFVEVSTGVTSAPSAFRFEAIVAGPLVANDLIGYVIEFTSGGFEGHRRHIARNTTTTIRFATGLASAPPAGVTFRILAPGVTLNNPDLTPRTIGRRASMGIVNIRFSSAGGGLELDRMIAIAYGLSTSTGVASSFIRGNATALAAGLSTDQFTRNYALALLSDLGVTSAQWQGWGVTGAEANGPAFATPLDQDQSAPMSFNGYLVGSASMSATAQWRIAGGNVNACFLSQGATLYITLLASDYLHFANTFYMQAEKGAQLVFRGPIDANGFAEAVDRDGDIFLAQSGGQIFFEKNTGGITIAHANGTCFTADDARISVGGAGGAMSITGTGSARGVGATNNAQVTLRAACTFDYSASSSAVAQVTNGSQLVTGATFTVLGISASCTDGQITAEGGWTLAGTDDVLHLEHGRLMQRGGVFTATASAGDAVNCIRGSNAAFLGAAATVITGSDIGLNCTGGSCVDFAGALSSVTGTTSALQLDGTNVAVAVLAGAGDFISGAAAAGSPGNSGGSSITRSA